MSYATDVAIPYPVHVAGFNVSVGAGGFTEQTAERYSDVVTLDGVTHRDVPYVCVGQPDTLIQYGFQLLFDGVQTDDDLAAMQVARARSGPIDVCIWKRITEEWVLASAATDFTLLRRHALTAVTTLPTGADTALVPIVRSGTSLSTLSTLTSSDYTIGSADVNGRTAFTLDVAAQVLQVSYVPLFMMRRISSVLSIPAKNIESWDFTFRECV